MDMRTTVGLARLRSPLRQSMRTVHVVCASEIIKSIVFDAFVAWPRAAQHAIRREYPLIGYP